MPDQHSSQTDHQLAWE